MGVLVREPFVLVLLLMSDAIVEARKEGLTNKV